MPEPVPLCSDSTRPLEFDLDRKKSLRIRWADGHECELPLRLLRRECPCATCRQEREAQAKNPLHVLRGVPAGEDAAVVESAEIVGNYALRFRWRDGHDTGIYEHAFLRDLCRCGPGGAIG